MQPEILFNAILVKIQTTIDGGWRVTLDVSQNDANAMLDLAKLRELLLRATIVPVYGTVE